MRTTTKIVIGIILSIFILVIGFIVVFSFSDRKHFNNYDRYRITTSQDSMQRIKVNPYKTIRLTTEVTQHECDYNVTPEGEFSLIPATNDAETNHFSFPKELSDFFTATSVNDTLFIKINMKQLQDKFGFKNKNGIRRMVSGFVFEANTNNIDVINDFSEINVTVRNIETDKIAITGFGSVYIENCKADVVLPAVKAEYREFKLKDSQVKKLNIDLDNMGNWFVENCDIEEENLTGSKSSHVQLPKSEAKAMNWLPKNNDAQLSVTLSGDTARIVYP